MKLTSLYESHAVYGPGESFYGDPKAKKQGKGDDSSILVGGTQDRARFLKAMQSGKKKKRKK